MGENKYALIGMLGICLLSLTACTNGYSNEDITNIINQLNQQNAIFYISDGCLHCQKQMDMLNNSVDYIDCREQPEICVSNNINEVPTLIIHGNRYEGVLSIEKLKNILNNEIAK